MKYVPKFQEPASLLISNTRVAQNVTIDPIPKTINKSDEEINKLFETSLEYLNYFNNGKYNKYDNSILPQISDNKKLLKQYSQLKKGNKRDFAKFVYENKLELEEGLNPYGFGTIDLQEYELLRSTWLKNNPQYGIEYDSPTALKAVEGINFAKDYYDSEGYRQRAESANLKYGTILYDLTLSLHPNTHVRWSPDYSINSSYSRHYTKEEAGDYYLGIIDLGAKPTRSLFTPLGVAAHEYAHAMPLFNTRDGHVSKNIDSPYYGNNYTNVPQEFAEILLPVNAQTEHDQELSEQYSDLVSLRQALKEEGIFDSTKAGQTFTLEMLNLFKKTNRANNERFLKLHNDKNIIRAINEIAQNNILKSNSQTAYAKFGTRLNYLNLFK